VIAPIGWLGFVPMVEPGVLGWIVLRVVGEGDGPVVPERLSPAAAA
jgi:hypothetical protein